MVCLVKCEADVEQLLYAFQFLVHGVSVDKTVNVICEAVDFLLRKSREGCVLSQFRKQLRQFIVIPAALYFVQSDVELAFLRLVEVNHRYVYLCFSLILKHG